MPPRRKAKKGVKRTEEDKKEIPREEKKEDFVDEEAERQAAAIRAIRDVEIEHTLTALDLLCSYFTEEQIQTPVLGFFKDNLPDLSIARDEESGEIELKWNDSDGVDVNDSILKRLSMGFPDLYSSRPSLGGYNNVEGSMLGTGNTHTISHKHRTYRLSLFGSAMQALHPSSLRASPPNPLLRPSNRQSHHITTNARQPTRRRSFISASSSAVSAPKRETDPKKRVVITGMGLVSVFGNDVDAYYEKLLSGESGISLIDRFDASKFPTRFGGQIRGFSSEGYIDGKNERRLDDCLKYCIVAGKKALESAGLGGDKLNTIDKQKAGVLVGTGMGGLTVFSDGVQALIEKGHRRISPFFIPYAITNMGSALLAIDLGLMGPNYSISTACATSNYCFYAAANHIRRGEADMMIAGGTEAAIIPIGLGGFVACRALSQRNDDPQTASRPWDKQRDGFVMGEGAGVLVMESLEHAMKRGAPIVAEYLGGAVNCDAHHMTDPRADGLGVSSCIESCLEDAGVSPEEVNYINAHATSTLAGDLAEINAIKKVFKSTSGIKINATKSMIGHCLGAAGGLEAIATVKAINTGWLHPSINQFNPEPAVDFDTVANEKKQHEMNVAISNSFGFGGHNSVVAFSAFKP